MSYRTASGPEMGYDSAAAVPSTSLVDRNTTIDGSLTTSGDLRINGRAHGTVHCDGTLTVSEDAVVDANVDAAGVVVAGTLTGDVTCRGRFEIRPTGVVRATVQTAALVIHEGAVYEGQLRMEASTLRETDESVMTAASATGDPTEDAGSSDYPFLRRFTSVSSSDEDDLPSTSVPPDDEDDEP